MTSRIGAPDTEADRKVRAILDTQPRRNFVVVAGAGSGKTTSLVKALDYVAQTRGANILRNGQQIACITYTKVAINEILGDVGNASLFNVSTIHSFLWTIVHPFVADLREWVEGRLDEKVAEAQARLANSKTKAATRPRLAEDIERFRAQRAKVAVLDRFNYGAGSNYAEGVLGHDDIIKIGVAFIGQRHLVRMLIRRRFPVVFVDESQDTQPDVVAALKRIAAEDGGEFTLGFFGDPMQQIYQTGAGRISVDDGWTPIEKPENFRCSQAVLRVINRVRAEGDRIVQVRGRTEVVAGREVPVKGTARIFIVKADEHREERLRKLRTWLAKSDGDPSWADSERNDGVRVLVLVHERAARQLGFATVYAALNDYGDSTLKEGLRDGSAWVFNPFRDFFLPVVSAVRNGADFELMNLLRKHSPILAPDTLAGRDVPAILARLQSSVAALVEMTKEGGKTSVREVLGFSRERDLFRLDDKFLDAFRFPSDVEIDDDMPADTKAALAFLRCPASEVWPYIDYIEDKTPFSTQQGVKGAEFTKVIVILDDEYDRYNLFSYNKYFGITSLSETDEKRVREGGESVLDRTRRLFYVCCSRATCDLVVLMFVPEPLIGAASEAAKRFFDEKDIKSATTMASRPPQVGT